MKPLSLLSIIFAFTFSRCSLPTSPDPAGDSNQRQETLMKSLAPQLVGEWTMKETQVKLLPAYSYSQREANITKDTTIQNLAILTIRPASNPRTKPVQTRYPEFEGTVQYKTKTYPIYFYLISSGEYLVNKTAPQAFFFLQYDFPTGSHQTEIEESYLQNIGLIGDTFMLSINEGHPQMVWEGLNRGLKRAVLDKK